MRPLQEISFGPEHFSPTSFLATWSPHVPGDFRPLLFSLFGDTFFADHQHRIHMLDTVALALRPIAGSEMEFFSCLDSDEYRRDWLMSSLAEAAERAGIHRSASECFAFRTPPCLGGELSPTNLVPWDFATYQIGLSKLFSETSKIALGNRVIVRERAGLA